MLRYGKKYDRCYGDKRARSNRGRARTSATAKDREHVNLGYRRGQAQLVEIRAAKKRSRLAAQLSIEDDLFDLELAQSDPEIWLHGTDLTTYEDTVTKHHRGYPLSFAADPYAYVPDAFDWQWEESSYQDYQDDEDGYLHDVRDYDSRDYASDWDAGGSDPDPEPIEAAWRALWVAGRAHDPEGRDLPDPLYDRWYHDTYDYLDEIENPLLLESEDPALPATIEAVQERNIERRRAGERYFKQTGRTVLKPFGTQRAAP